MEKLFEQSVIDVDDFSVEIEAEEESVSTHPENWMNLNRREKDFFVFGGLMRRPR